MPLVIENPPAAHASEADEATFATACAAVGDPPLPAKAALRDGVPRGTIRTFNVGGIGVSPETRRDVRVYTCRRSTTLPSPPI